MFDAAHGENAATGEGRYSPSPEGGSMKKTQFHGGGLLIGAVLIALSITTSAFGMTKTELVDAVAQGSKLTKADAGRALDATLDAVTGILADQALKNGNGDRISLFAFGTFSVSERVPADSATCVPVTEVEFGPANAFDALINPIAMDKGLRFRVQNVSDSPDGLTATGVVQQGSVSVGDVLLTSDRPGQIGGITGGVVAGIVVAALKVNEATAGQTASLLLRGIDKKDIRRGMVFTKAPAPEDPGPPTSPCFGYVLDEQVAAQAAKISGLPYASVLAVLQVTQETIKETVASGHAVDLEGFGVFYVLGERVLSAVDPGTDLPAGKAKKAVKFKAGADLATSVNK
jgi:DNA-binding protein HU-beta